MCNRNKFSNFFFLSSNKIKTQVQLGRKSWGQWWYVLSEMLHHQYLELRVKYYVKKKNHMEINDYSEEQWSEGKETWERH